LPLYPYRCTQCGYRFEKIQSFSAEPERVCPKCGGTLERTLTAPRFQFKGSGWYINDYAPKSTETAAESTTETKPSESKEPASASETPSTAPAAPESAPTPAPTPKRAE
jgi:putative FmdB family regulatory protein